jgi:hypothetical protein
MLCLIWLFLFSWSNRTAAASPRNNSNLTSGKDEGYQYIDCNWSWNMQNLSNRGFAPDRIHPTLVSDETGSQMIGMTAIEDISRGSLLLAIPMECVFSTRTATANNNSLDDNTEKFAMERNIKVTDGRFSIS